MPGPEEQGGASFPGVAVGARPRRAGGQDQRLDPLLPPGGDRVRWEHLGARGRTWAQGAKGATGLRA